jgi:nucleoside-diphosphate-sugar epimerase
VQVNDCMIIGSGLLAKSFGIHLKTQDDVCIYAAGVSNSSCTDHREFEREQTRLLDAFRHLPGPVLFVYFSTCSISDPSAQGTSYVEHKTRMETLVKERSRYLIFRLPQVAGRTPNPHTLLNYLFARIIRSERFEIWGYATRNIIDAGDIVRIASDLINVDGACNETINIASTRCYGMLEVVTAMGRVLNHTPIFDIIDRGSSYDIDTSRISASLERCRIYFSNYYLDQVLWKYYGVTSHECD